MKHYFITGATGFIGTALATHLAENNLVYALAINESEADNLPNHPNIIPVIGDLLLGKIDNPPTQIDYFIHLAWLAMSTPDSVERNSAHIQLSNLSIAINAAELAIKCNSNKFVFVGSNQEYVVGTDSIDGSVTMASTYGVMKYCARHICRLLSKDKMEFNAVAFTNVFGVGDYSKRTANLFIHNLLCNKPLKLIEGNNLYDWTYIDDAVEGLIAVAERGISNKQYYIGSRHMPTFKEIITRVRDIINPEAELRFGEYSDNTYTDYTNFDLELLYKDTQYECSTDFKTAILKTAEWVKSLKW